MQIIPYIIPGFPTLRDSLKNINTLIEYSNIPYIEIGIPSNNPYMDGPIIKNCHKVIRENKFTIQNFIYFLTKRYPGNAARKLILMAYLEDIDSFGIQKFKKGIETCEIAACIIIGDYIKVIDFANYLKIPAIPIVSSSYDENILNLFMKTKPPFLYFKVSSGKTGKARFFSKSILSDSLQNIKKKWPTMRIFAGFGIEHVLHTKLMKEIGFDGIIVGSILLNMIVKGQSIYSFIYKVGEI